MDGLLDQRPLSYFVHASDQAGGLALLCAAAAGSRKGGIRKGLGFRRVRAEVAGGGGGAAAGGRVRVRTAAGATRGEMRESNQRRRRICGHAGEAEQGI